MNTRHSTRAPKPTKFSDYDVDVTDSGGGKVGGFDERVLLL